MNVTIILILGDGGQQTPKWAFKLSQVSSSPEDKCPLGPPTKLRCALLLLPLVWHSFHLFLLDGPFPTTVG